MLVWIALCISREPSVREDVEPSAGARSRVGKCAKGRQRARMMRSSHSTDGKGTAYDQEGAAKAASGQSHERACAALRASAPTPRLRCADRNYAQGRSLSRAIPWWGRWIRTHAQIGTLRFAGAITR
eukprot:1178634-Pleurochrysis_carterae.AAC.1